MLDRPTSSLTGAARPIAELLSATAARHGERVAIDFMGKTWRYAELDALVNRAAAGLQGLGVVPGTRVGLCLPNSPYAVIFFFAALRAGAVVVNYNPLYVERELAHAVRDSGTDIMVTMDLTAMEAMVRSGSLSSGTPESVRNRSMVASSSSVSP